MNPTHEKMLRYFRYEHLPEGLHKYSKPFYNLAVVLISRIDDGADPAETTVALRKLLEAKDAAVRAMIL